MLRALTKIRRIVPEGVMYTGREAKWRKRGTAGEENESKAGSSKSLFPEAGLMKLWIL
jgi:hypothetical protein